MTRKYKILGHRTCSRQGCERRFDVTVKTANETECTPHRGARKAQATRERMQNDPEKSVWIVHMPSDSILEPAPVLTDAEARELLAKVSLAATVPYLGFREPWPSRCMYCLAAHHPTLEVVRALDRKPGKTARFCTCRGTKKRI